MVKSINEENLFVINNLNANKYNSEVVYKIIKKCEIPYLYLTKNSILLIIFNYDNLNKTGNKNENSEKEISLNEILDENNDNLNKIIYENKIEDVKINFFKGKEFF